MTNHLMQNNSYPQTVNPEVSRMQPQFSNSDEIDLKELLHTLKRGKWIIVCSTMLVGCMALIYAFVTSEVWTTSVKVTQPKINDYYQLSSEVKKFQPVLVEENNDELKKHNELSSLIKANLLFRQYIDAFNSSINKKIFLDNNDVYKQYLVDNNVSEDEVNFVLNEWIKNIQATPEKKRNGSPSFYLLSFTTYSQDTSYLLLKEYSAFIADLVNNQVIDGINKTIISYATELKTASSLLRGKALNRLEMEKKKTEVALNITTKAAIDKPILSYANNDLFPINLGKNANLAKKEALKDMTDLSIFEPELISLNSKLKFLSENKQINPDVEFSTIRYIEDINLPLSKDKPKRTLIVVFGLLLGAIFGVAYVLVRQAFKD